MGKSCIDLGKYGTITKGICSRFFLLLSFLDSVFRARSFPGFFDVVVFLRGTIGFASQLEIFPMLFNFGLTVAPLLTPVTNPCVCGGLFVRGIAFHVVGFECALAENDGPDVDRSRKMAPRHGFVTFYWITMLLTMTCLCASGITFFAQLGIDSFFF